MSELIQVVINSEEKNDLRQFISNLRHQQKRYLLRNDLVTGFQ